MLKEKKNKIKKAYLYWLVLSLMENVYGVWGAVLPFYQQTYQYQYQQTSIYNQTNNIIYIKPLFNKRQRVPKRQTDQPVCWE